MLDGMLATTSSHHRLPGGRPFHLILLALATSALGDWMYNVALLALVFGRTGSATWVALTTAARVLPVVVVGPLGGVLADRYDRRALMVGADVARTVLMVGLAVVAAAGLPILLAPVLAALATAASTVTSPSVAASTARLVADDELQPANALRAAIGQGAVVAGPALGAVVLALADPATAILLNGATFAVSAPPSWPSAATRPSGPAPAAGARRRASAPNCSTARGRCAGPRAPSGWWRPTCCAAACTGFSPCCW